MEVFSYIALIGRCMEMIALFLGLKIEIHKQCGVKGNIFSLEMKVDEKGMRNILTLYRHTHTHTRHKDRFQNDNLVSHSQHTWCYTTQIYSRREIYC